MSEKKRDLVVRVRREPVDGQVYSMIVDRSRVDDLGREAGVVIDRARRGRHYCNQESVIDRAKCLADLLGIKCEVDLRWPCALHLGLRCGCPKCVEAGR